MQNTHDPYRSLPPSQVLNCIEAATILGVSSVTIRTWADKGYLPLKGRTAKGHRRFSLGEVLHFRDLREATGLVPQLGLTAETGFTPAEGLIAQTGLTAETGFVPITTYTAAK